MSKAYFQSIESSLHNHKLPLTEVMDNLNFNAQGLIPVIAQDLETQKVLMQAWMNREAVQKTLYAKRMIYWSRSRHCYWDKGATSGHIQSLVSMAFDCDGDVILCQVKQLGAACHTGRSTCFYLDVEMQQQQVSVIGEARLPLKHP
jgi:phosphoribosyl-AMP cyclohydrolase